MRAVISLTILLTFASGCSKDNDSKPTKAGKAAGPPSANVKKLSALADEGCACKDYACTKRIYAKVSAFGKRIKTVSDSDKPAMQAAQQRLDDCTVKYNPFMISYKKLAARVCACKTKKCAQGVAADVGKWSAKVKATPGAIQRGHLQEFMGYGKTAASCFQGLGVPVPR